MIFYTRYPGDYLRDTQHLSTFEHGAYTLLLDAFYSKEKPIKHSNVYRICGAKNKKERALVDSVLEEFWRETEDGWVNERALKEIEKSISRQNAGRAGGKSKWKDYRRSTEQAETRSQRMSQAKERGQHTKEQWSALRAFCGDKCVRCGGEGEIVKDHIIPIYQDGSDSIENLQPICRRCNAQKGPETIDHRPEGWSEVVFESSKTSSRTTSKTSSKHLTPQPQPQPQPEDQDQKIMSSKESDDDKVMIDTAFELWHRIASEFQLPMVAKQSPARKKKLLNILKNHGGLEAWAFACGKIRVSAHLQGHNDRGWRANFDFMTRESSFIKVTEGVYDGNGQPATELPKADRKARNYLSGLARSRCE